MLLSIIVFFLIFSTLILIHEWGHFSSARRHGVKVEEFGLGIPPKAKVLWKDKKGCEFTLNWIPFGGFVRMEGEDAVDEKLKKTKTSFAAKSLLARMEIVLAGVFMNFILAIVLLTGLYSFGSSPILLDIHSVKENVDKGLIILDEGIPVIAITEGGPADKAGLQVGDIVLNVNGETITEAEQISGLQEENTEKIYDVLRPLPNQEGVPVAEQKREALSLSILSNSEAKIQVGFSLLPYFKEVKNLKLPVHQAFIYSLQASYDIAKATLKAFKSLVVKIVTQAQVPQGIAGPVGIAAMTHGIVETGDIGNLIKFMALLSLSLAIMNVLPIPALDGGRFLFLIVEGIMQKPIKAEWEARIHSGAFILLIALIFIVTWNDIYRLIFEQ
ncbi:PDZ domain-containing protein [Candidatus Peregrinibacteria bacterium]|jgi:regulator of sigma E protease|nr:PDZ domain-containing protein [Candidatus Peregrinibacteria bacterium]